MNYLEISLTNPSNIHKVENFFYASLHRTYFYDNKKKIWCAVPNEAKSADIWNCGCPKNADIKNGSLEFCPDCGATRGDQPKVSMVRLIKEKLIDVDDCTNWELSTNEKIKIYTNEELWHYLKQIRLTKRFKKFCHNL